MTYRMQRLTALGISVFTPIARNGHALKETRCEANAYAERALSLAIHAKDGEKRLRLGASSIKKFPVVGEARTMFFMRLGAWWFPDSFPKFTPAFTASHFPVTECWIVTTDVEVDADSRDEAVRKAHFDATTRVCADPTLLGETEFFCRRMGVASRFV